MKPYHYIESGLANVYLVNGYELNRRQDGLPASIEDVDALHQVMGKLLVQKAGALDGPEIRFLRQGMNRFQAGLGSALGVSGKSVLRWEHDRSRIPRSADLSLRVHYLEWLDCPCPREALDRLMGDHRSLRKPEPMILDRVHQQWCLLG